MGKSELLNILGEVKARVQDKLGVVDFPMPQFILIGKQSVGKSRLIESLAGEQFNFCSGTLGSRRPTVLEFRNEPNHQKSRWFVRDRRTNQWGEHPVQKVMHLVGAAHEELGCDVTKDPVYVRIESPACPDMQIVDLPGFREFAQDRSKVELAGKIDDLVRHFMRDANNVMLCVEEAGDASTMSTLAKCRELDPRFERTVLIRNKLDKYYGDLTPENIGRWCDGHGDLPKDLVRFAVTLPHWQEGAPPPKPFVELRDEMSRLDAQTLQSKGMSSKYMSGIGFTRFTEYMEKRVEQMFADALGPVMANLKQLRNAEEKAVEELQAEHEETDPVCVLSTTRDCGASFGSALNHVMEGVIRLKDGRVTLEEELLAFHDHHKILGSSHFTLLPSQDFQDLDDYIDYLKNEIQVGASDVRINGGAQFRRMMMEVEIFLRFSEIADRMTKRDVIQARGVSMGSWRDVVVKLLSHDAHVPLQRQVLYVGERIKWFFCRQKEAVLDFMDGLEGNPSANMFSPLYTKHVKLIRQNETIRQLIFETYDAAVDRQLKQFTELFQNSLTSMFTNPWVFLKLATSDGADEEALEDAVLSFEEMKDRIPHEIDNRAGIEKVLADWLSNVPTEGNQIDVAVEKVQTLVLRTYSFIRSQVCDQVELFAESFFKLPMLRRLEEDMSLIQMTEDHKRHYEARRGRLGAEIETKKESLEDINGCIERLQSFAAKVAPGLCS